MKRFILLRLALICLVISSINAATPQLINYQGSLTDSTFLKKADISYVVKVIKGGGLAVDLSAMMPPYGRTLTITEIEKLAEYVMLLSKGHTE